MLLHFFIRRIYRDNEVEGTSDGRRHPNELEQKLATIQPHPKIGHFTQTAFFHRDSK
jgi:hypothetical protein